MREPTRDEHAVAEAIADYLSSGDAILATGHGLVSLHPIHRRSGVIIARKADGEEYEVTITAQRRR